MTATPKVAFPGSFPPFAVGANAFPAFPLFNRILEWAHRKPDSVVIDDVTGGYRDATHIRLLTDVLRLRDVFRGSLTNKTLRRLAAGEDVCITLLAPGGYEYTVGFLAILAIGAIIVPLSISLPAQEALYFASKARAVAVVTSSTQTKKGKELQELVLSSSNPTFGHIEVKPHVWKSVLAPTDILISSRHVLDYNGGGIVIFTSGTTGPPKGVLKARSWLDSCSMNLANHFGFNEHDRILHVLPVHHVTGISINFLPLLLTGGCIEFRTGGFDAGAVWERLREGGITIFSVVPTIYMRMMRYYEVYISKLPPAGEQEYVDAVRNFKVALCGTSALPMQLMQKWERLLGDKRILQRYGASESSGAIYMFRGDEQTPSGSVGRLVPGVDVKLSEGNEGEMLIKSPYMFSRYIYDPEATAKAFTSDGYYRSGDIARREGAYYFIMGRASVDIIKSGGYKISALDVEREILGLEYISEVMVVGVEDEEYGQRVAAAVVLKDNIDLPLDLKQLRGDLRNTLAGYKTPTILRVVDNLPKTASGKVLKKQLGIQLFSTDDQRHTQRWKSKEMVARL